MNRTLTLLATFTCLVFPAGGQEPATKTAGDIPAMIRSFQETTRAPCVSIAVGRGGEIALAEAFGVSDLENAVQATEETVFRTASIAKSITAVAVLQLVDAGKIALDDPIHQHCPEFPPQEHALTVRHLLCHQGGIRHYKSGGESAGTRHFATLADSLVLFQDDPLLFKPGTDYSYTTYGYTLLGRAVETASGKSFRQYLQEHVFDPAGMEDAGLDDTFRLVPNRTRGYVLITIDRYFRLPLNQRQSVRVGDLANCQLHDTSMKIPGGGLICSPTDLVKFGQAMLGDRLIEAETRKIAWTEQRTSGGQPTGYGLGWGLGGDERFRTVGHSGGQAGTSTMLMIFPDHDLVVAVMCNLQGAPTRKLAFQIGQSLASGR